jgi:hypothetical protein
MSTTPQSIRDAGYEVVRRLGGHERDVFLARQSGKTSTERFILARFDLGEAESGTFEEELGHCSALEHPGVAKPVDMFTDAAGVVVVMEGLRGASIERLLDQLTDEQEWLTDAATLQIGLSLCEALQAMHTARDLEGNTLPLVHGQLGYHQLFLSWDGRVRLLGAGMSLVFRLGSAVGALPPAAEPFVAPEVHGGGMLTVRANVYSAAAMLWSLLAQRPFDPNASLAEARPDLDAKLVATIGRALDPSLATRRLLAGELAQTIAASGLASAGELEAYASWLRSFEEMDASTIGPESFPPVHLSEAPPSSVATLISLPPESIELEELRIPPLAPLVTPRPSVPYLQRPAPAANKPPRPPPPRRGPPKKS